MEEKTIEIRDGNRDYVENFLRRIYNNLSSKEEIRQIEIVSEKRPDTYVNHYEDTMKTIKGLEHEIPGPETSKIVLKKDLTKGLEEDLLYFATAKNINFNEILFRASKYQNVKWGTKYNGNIN